MAALEAGFVSIASMKERSGRGVIYTQPSISVERMFPHDMALRAIWYVIHAILESETAQQKGVVIIVTGKNYKLANFEKKWVMQCIDTLKGCCPIRISAFKLCHPPAFFNIVWPFLKRCMDSVLRKRVRVYAGSNAQIVSKLKKDGMCSYEIPESIGGDLEFNMCDWIKKRYAAGL